MANESTYASMSALVNPIWEEAMLTLSEQSIMPGLVKNDFTPSDSSTPRKWSQYTGGTIQTVAETTDMSAQTFTPAAAGTLTPTQFGLAYFLTDQRIRSDTFGARADAGTDLGRVVAVKVDSDLIGNFASFTGGTVGTAGGTLTWANIQRASAYLKTAFAPAPYRCVLHPVQWYYLTSATTGVPTLLQSQALMDQFGRNFYQASWSGIDFFVDANITSGTAAAGGMFNREAIGFDQRQGFSIEPQRDASRGGGGFELNATILYAQGLYRPTFGCLLTGTSA